MNTDSADLKADINSLSCLVLGGTEDDVHDWKGKVPEGLYKSTQKGTGPKYEGKKLCDLVRLIRNKVGAGKGGFYQGATCHGGGSARGSRSVTTASAFSLICHSSL